MTREEVSKVIKELQQACRRSVYNANFPAEKNGANQPTSSAFRFKRQRVERISDKTNHRIDDDCDDRAMRTWETILTEAASLLPYMTTREHGRVSKLASILLLGFFLPHSTGNEFFLLQNQSSLTTFNNNQKEGSHQTHQQQHQTAGAKTSEQPHPNLVVSNPSQPQQQEDQKDAAKAIQSAVIDRMTLSERLQRSSHVYNAHECGELHSICHDPMELILDSFLKHALVPFLKNRPAHTQQVDLLHILAMAIHPHPTEQSVKDVVLEIEDDEEKDEEEEEEENGKEADSAPTPQQKRDIETKKKKQKIWECTQLLMTNIAASSFQLQYRHRLLLVQIVTDCLVVPSIHSSTRRKAVGGNHLNAASALFDGAIPHLRASLYAFGLAAMSPYDAHWAQCGLVAVSVQTRKLAMLTEEWNRLLHRLVEDKTNYMLDHHGKDDGDQPLGDNIDFRSATSFSFMFDCLGSWNDPNAHTITGHPKFCPHQARGHLLERFLSWYCQSRKHAEQEFLQHALGSLTEAIEWLLECWTQDDDDEEDDDDDEKMEDAKVKGSEEDKIEDTKEESRATEAKQTTNDPPRVLASLLLTATSIFYYLLPFTDADKKGGEGGEEAEESGESEPRDMLVTCGIQLIHHPDPAVAREASNLLVLAFAYGPEEMSDDYAGAIFESTRMALDLVFSATDSSKFHVPIEGFISTFANKSASYADAMLLLLLSSEQQDTWKIDGERRKLMALYRLVPLIATASPNAATRHLEKLLELLDTQQPGDSVALHIAAAVMACRNAQLFDLPGDDTEKKVVESFGNDLAVRWGHYLLARHAMVTGNFGIAKTLYRRLCLCQISEQSFVWFSVLEKIASSESLLANNGAKGIPHSTAELRSALSLLYEAPSLLDSKSNTFAFQTSFISLRLEFLDMLVTIRQLACEMRLTNIGPKKNTRANLHLRNCMRHFDSLAVKYLTLYRQYGLFVDQQSRSSIRTFHALSRFLADAVRQAFSKVVPEAAEAAESQKRMANKGAESHPLTLLMVKLDDAVVKEITPSVDAKVRAAAVIGIIDHLLRAPCPFPRDFFCTKSIPRSSVCLSGDPDSDHTDSDYLFDEELEVPLGSLVTFNVSGSIPADLLKRSNLPFFVIVLWHTITPCGQVDEDELEPEGNDKEKVATIKKPIQMTTTADLSPNGSFFVKVQCHLFQTGRYRIRTRLGCRDVRGGEWELPLGESNRSISVRIRSKD
ncbi:unnamed protein product [Cylindrotheca closterium]|uniref:Integrator complex subunit 7 helical bundle domain-containing protein n=1 Tax=Cylindrotheca closterium TaxID=2856 RepID=A0AAD2FVL2_9STRA|nr:unnamed protein product [Cylindrotheca closterium]